MDRNQLLTSTSRCGTSGRLFAVITSFKICVATYLIFMLLMDMFYYAIPLMVLGTATIFLVLRYYQIPVASEESVAAFFGSDVRPVTVMSSPSGLFSTLRNRLQVQSQGQSGQQRKVQTLTIVGHRGAGLDAPENSISAFRLCSSRGCGAVEFDVSITKDNVPVIFHDDNILRMTGIDREVTDMIWDELRQVDISVLHPLAEKFSGEKIPTLDEALTVCISLGLKCFIDLKDNGDERVVRIILDAFKKYPGLYQSAAITSFSPKLLYLIRSQDPNIIGCMAWRPGYHRYRKWNENWENLELRNSSIILSFRDMLWDLFDELGLNHIYWWFLGLSTYNLHKDCMSLEATYRWTKKGIRLFLATPNSALEKLHIVQNMQLGYFTDTLIAGDLTSSSNMANFTEISVAKLQSSNISAISDGAKIN